jgi:Tol biopolymer transport system component
MYGCALTNDLKATTQSPVPIVSALTASIGNGGAQYALSDTGLMIYVVGARGVTGDSMPHWIDFEGVETPLFPEPTDLFSPAISPDGTRIAFHEGYGDAIVVHEIRRGIQTPVYPTEFRQYRPIWSPDGKRIVFSGQTEEHRVPSLMIVPADGETAPVRVGKGDLLEQFPSDWSRDGTMILYDEPRPDTRRDILIYHVETGEIETVIASRAEDRHARFSPDGEWIVYSSDLSGTKEIYLRRLDGAGSRLQVSVGGGAAPRWAPDGSSVYYMVSRLTMTGRAGTLMRVAIALTTDPPTIGAPEPAVELKPSLFSDHQYDIDPSGERILIIKMAESGDAESSTRIHLVMNWFEELERALSRNGESP